MPGIDQHVHIEWRGGTCRVKWWCGELLPNGRKRYESKGGFTDEDEAFRHGQDKLYEIRHGTNVSNRDGATMFNEWVADWLASVDVKPITERNYKSMASRHIEPFFKHVAVGDVDVLTYRAFKKHILGKLGPSSARNVLMLLGMMLDDAVPRLIKTSPVERTRRRGTYKKKPRERKRDVPLAAVEQLAQNMRALLGQSGYVFVWTMAMTGMRPAELYGLRREYCYPYWPAADPREDPDEEDRYEEDAERYGKAPTHMPAIRVQQQVQSPEGGLRFFPPKYDSYRSLVVPPFLAEMLEDLLESHDSPWVFPALGGGSLGAASLNRRYWRPSADGSEGRDGPGVRRPRPKLEEVPGWKGKRLYLLRHAHKAWLDEDGIHSRFAIERRMGHEVQGVEGLYSSVTVPMEQNIANALQVRWEKFTAGRDDKDDEMS
ncbi:tyrosine recombinase XerC [Streptomyces sp. NPDC059534]|uniref:site-specific integrase n=1 Tax=Streptomyces sp. NPDC059534 TaxID=3346859 RepID=UPI003690E154